MNGMIKNADKLLQSYISYTDEQLLSSLRDGSECALAELYDRYAPALVKTAAAQLDLQAAEEIVQDIFLNLWRIRSTLDIQNPEAYLRQSLKNRVINFALRHKHPRFFELSNVISASVEPADDRIRQKDMDRLIALWIQALPEKRKQVFIKHYVNRFSTSQIAYEMNVSEKTVQNNLSLCLNYIRARLKYFLLTIFVIVRLLS